VKSRNSSQCNETLLVMTVRPAKDQADCRVLGQQNTVLVLIPHFRKQHNDKSNMTHSDQKWRAYEAHTECTKTHLDVLV